MPNDGPMPLTPSLSPAGRGRRMPLARKQMRCLRRKTTSGARVSSIDDIIFGFAVLILALLALLPAARAETPFAPAQAVLARSAMVVSQEQRATHIGIDVLRKGGNAVDAAVAV